MLIVNKVISPLLGYYGKKFLIFSVMPEKAFSFSGKNSKHCLCGNTGSFFPTFPKAET